MTCVPRADIQISRDWQPLATRSLVLSRCVGGGCRQPLQPHLRYSWKASAEATDISVSGFCFSHYAASSFCFSRALPVFKALRSRKSLTPSSIRRNLSPGPCSALISPLTHLNIKSFFHSRTETQSLTLPCTGAIHSCCFTPSAIMGRCRLHFPVNAGFCHGDPSAGNATSRERSS